MTVSRGKNWEVRFDFKALEKKWGKYNDRVAKVMTDETVKEMKKSLKKRNNSSGMSPSSPGSPPAMVTGDLIKSIKAKKFRNKKNKTDYKIVISSPYAKIQENGGTISAKRSQYLTIPLNQEAVELRRSTKNLRNIKSLFVIQKKGKEPMLVKKVRNGIKPMFALKRTVYLAPRPFIRPAVKKVLNRSEKIIAEMNKGNK